VVLIKKGLWLHLSYVLGHEAMKRMAVSNVLISGMGGLGIEVAKDVVLAGVKSVTIHDESLTSWSDLSSQVTGIDLMFPLFITRAKLIIISGLGCSRWAQNVYKFI